jgi:hypothetical protein
VTTEAALIETTKSDIAGVVTPTEIQSLPLLNRTFAALSVVMPEARPVGNFDPTKARMGSVAMSGGDGRQLDVNVDGGDNKDNVVGSLLQNFAYESIQEFQVLQHRWTAESGRAVGGVINVITKSGNNTLRGSLFGNGRNQDTRAHDFFENQLRARTPDFEKPSFSRQEFGGSIGGPIRQDNLFYFGAIERFRERQNTPVRAAAIPHLEALQNVMGITAVSEIPQPYDDTLLSVKVDHRLSDRQTMSYRYSQQNNSSPNDQVGSPANTDLTGGNTTTNDLYSFLVNHTFTLGPTRLNQFSFHVQDFLNEKLSVTDTPNIVFPTVQTGANVNVPQATSVRKWQFRNDFTWHAGSHSLQSGVNPYVHKLSFGFQHSLTPNWSVSSDYVHTRGENEARVMVINERIQDICDPAFPGASPDSPRCVRGANTRYFDAAFAAAGLGAGRLEQINMIDSTNSSRFDSWTTTLRGRLPWGQASISYVLANSRSWGGQPTASYSGNAIATTPENQFKPEEWGPTRLDERHRIVASGVFNLPYQIQVAPLMQFATARPYALNAGLDLDGDGLNTNDRICAGVDPRAALDARGNSAAVLALNPRGCTQVQVNSQRSGFVVNQDGSLSEQSGNFFNVDLRLTKAIAIRGFNIKPYADFYNLFNTENLSLANRLGQSYATSAADFMQPVSLFGPGFGPPVGRPLTMVFGARLDF